MDYRTRKVIALMAVNLRQNPSLENLAQSVNLSASRLRHLFKEDMGVTPTQYFQALRMEHARHLLETTFMRVKEIAPAVGMGRDSCLVREFKKTYGVAPAQYRLRRAGPPAEANVLRGEGSRIGQ